MSKFLIGIIISLAFFHAQAQDSLVIMEINFDLDSYVVSKSERSKIDSALQLTPIDFLKKVEIFGHTDSLAGVEYNKRLSKNRVSSLLRYLVNKGLDPLRVKTDYYGEEKPKYDNSPETRYRNRRVELWMYVDIASVPEPEKKLSEIDLKTGDKIQIPNLNFVGNQPLPVWESFPVLEELLLLMQNNPDLQIELHGHVCCSDNLELSAQRAFTIYEFLRSNGIKKNRLAYKGLSNSRPLFKEISDREEALNRRVEVLVVKNTTRKVTSSESKAISIRTRLNSINFFPGNTRMYPSGDHNIRLVIEMLKKSKGLEYELIIYDNIGDESLSMQRAKFLNRKLSQGGISRGTCLAKSKPKLDRMPESANSNFIILKVKRK